MPKLIVGDGINKNTKYYSNLFKFWEKNPWKKKKKAIKNNLSN